MPNKRDDDVISSHTMSSHLMAYQKVGSYNAEKDPLFQKTPLLPIPSHAVRHETT